MLRVFWRQFDIAEKYGVEIVQPVADEPPGTIVYEDEYQIGVVMER